MKFTKMHGLGNDYIYIDCIKGEKIENPSYLAKTMSNRHFGIGSDGLILICKSNIADFKMQMFNYDGSEAEMCGNGIRCVGKYVYDNELTNNKIITVETLGGIKKLKLNIKNKKVETVEVDMGEPIFEAEKIPVLSDKYPVKNLKIIAEDKEFTFTCVSMGNPHAVTIIKNVIDFDVQRYGEILEKSKIFPQRANIEFVQILDKENVKMRVWERGTGETLACGTGACATVVACNLNGYVKNDVNVELPGGILKIKWNKENNHVYMTGPAITVFRGEIVEPLGN
ncbi:MAG TPA: diaminopimelate epimerase [Clostridiaceae bacterium]|nr:diaminopimelate epimerase [Clostridiaceae bacterium]